MDDDKNEQKTTDQHVTTGANDRIKSAEDRICSDEAATRILTQLDTAYVTKIINDLQQHDGLRLSQLGVCKCIALWSGSSGYSGGSPLPSSKQVLSEAINISLKHVGDAFMTDDWRHGLQSRPGLWMVQIVNCRNLSASSLRQDLQTYPRMIGMSVSDGYSKMKAIEYEHVSMLKVDLPPGTKLILQDLMIDDGVIQLRPANVVRICGNVKRLTEGWRIKMESMHARNFASTLADGEEPPPKLIPYSDRSAGGGGAGSNERKLNQGAAPAAAAASVPHTQKQQKHSGGGGGNQNTRRHHDNNNKHHRGRGGRGGRGHGRGGRGGRGRGGRRGRGRGRGGGRRGRGH